ncbi:MAG: methylenetetrahydrofolate--tRNA-(uracil(54)-C(5))-methyltransferase (FADH(2)-oxidizing) TrmFO [Christensenellales bacterium]
MSDIVTVIGAGLAGCEATWQLAKRGINVVLCDIKPSQFTPAHSNPNFAEIVCSNSLKSMDNSTASGLLKLEMEKFDSLILRCAYSCRVPAGNALAVDREKFAEMVTSEIKSLDNVKIVSGEVQEIPQGTTILATGPLTTDKLSKSLINFLEQDNLAFYDASSPIVERESINMTKAFVKDRYDKGDGDYINCPMNKTQYLEFYNQLINAERVELKNFEKKEIFEGCMPIEVMAMRGEDSLRFGPLKPIGLDNPTTGEKYYAVVQLRPEDKDKRLYNLVGFQTNLLFPEQKRVFSLIPGLGNAKFVKYGVMHRNTYINAPQILKNTFQTKKREDLFIAGQLSGVEGYMESTMSGLLCGINAYLLVKGKPLVSLSSNTMMGAIANFITTCPQKNFQPMNANFGIVSPLEQKIKDNKQKREKIVSRSLEEIEKVVKMMENN